MNLLAIYSDACCDPNPGGPMSRAHVLLDADGTEIGSVPASVENSTNVDEYLAFGHTLRWLLDRLLADPDFRSAYPGVVVYTDSQLVAKQILGEWSVKAAILRPYYTRCLELIGKLKGLGPFVIEWIPCEQNRADALSREAFKSLVGRYPKVWTKRRAVHQ